MKGLLLSSLTTAFFGLFFTFVPSPQLVGSNAYFSSSYPHLMAAHNVSRNHSGDGFWISPIYPYYRDYVHDSSEEDGNPHYLPDDPYNYPYNSGG